MSMAAHTRRVEKLFAELAGLADCERVAALHAACGEDRQLQEAVARLLRADEVACAEQFLEWAPGSLSADAPPEALLGKRLGPYVIVARIAAGAMGVVYRAKRAEGFQQQVAIKILRPWMGNAEAVARFRAEQQALADLPHPHIARLLDAGVTEDGCHYLVQEYVDGYRLDDAVAALQPSLDEKLAWLLTICHAIAFAHQRGIIHRDLKPANVLMQWTDRTKAARQTGSDGPSAPAEIAPAQLVPKITDFGLARIGSAEGGGLTVTGEVMGTPGYMAPEQLSRAKTKMSPQTDVYGLGAVLYFLLTGKPPFRASSLTEFVHELEHRDPEAPAALTSGISPDLNNICLKCLEKRPADRYAGADELADDIQRYLAGYPVRARPIGWSGRLVRWSRRNRTTAALLGTLAATLIGGLVATTSLYLAAVRGQREAEDERAAVLQTIDRLLTEVSKSIQYQQGSQPVRQALLASAKEAYDAQVAARQGDDKQLQVEDATATYRLAQIHHQAYQWSECDRLARDAMTQFRHLAERYPDEHRFQFDIFHCWLLLHDYESAYTIISDLIRKYPLADYREAAAGTACHLASKVRMDDPQRAEQLLRDGLALAKALTQEFPDRARFQRSLRHAYSGLAILKLDELDYRVAQQYVEQAIAIGKQLVHDTPQEAGFRTQLVGDLRVAHCISRALGDTDKNSEFLAQATAIAREGLQLNPQQLAIWSNYIGALRQQIDQFRGPWQPPDQHVVDLVKEHLFALRAAQHFWPDSEEPLQLLHAEFLADCPLEAMRDLEQAERLTSHWSAQNVDANWAQSLGVVRLRCGRYQEAWACFRRAYPDTERPKTIYAALAAARMGDLQTADRILQDLGAPPYIQQNRRLLAELNELKTAAAACER